jgi:NitT/TauT family transport system permease protein
MSASYSLFMLIAAEMMGGESGLGFLIVFSQKFYQVRNVYALVIVIALLGLIVDKILDIIERRFLSYSCQEDLNA